jgi:predicted amidophosphoribosyltransferase
LTNGLRLSQIDDSTRGDHYHLTSDDTCYYLFEYTSHRDYSFSGTNNLISNLKKKPSLASQASYKYKARAINECASHLASTLNPNWLKNSTLVPVPGSKALGHPDYDDRVERICRTICQPSPDVRQLVTQTTSTNASHEVSAGERVTVSELLDAYSINWNVASPTPRAIAIVDDVLTAGTHYRAMHTMLTNHFPTVPLVGIFIARRVFPDDNSYDF